MKSRYQISLFACLFLFMSANAVAQPPEIIKACEANVKSHCANVEKGRGRIARCLHENKDKLSDTCKAKVEELEARIKERHENRGAVPTSNGK